MRIGALPMMRLPAESAALGSKSVWKASRAAALAKT